MEMKTKTLFAAMSFLTICSMAAQAQIPQQSIRWDKHSLIFDGKRVVPVMGEVHYSRIPQNEWREEVRKMKEGGVTMRLCVLEPCGGSRRCVQLEWTAQSSWFP